MQKEVIQERSKRNERVKGDSSSHTGMKKGPEARRPKARSRGDKQGPEWADSHSDLACSLEWRLRHSGGPDTKHRPT